MLRPRSIERDAVTERQTHAGTQTFQCNVCGGRWKWTQASGWTSEDVTGLELLSGSTRSIAP
jgi:hypothetical protein